MSSASLISGRLGAHDSADDILGSDIAGHIAGAGPKMKGALPLMLFAFPAAHRKLHRAWTQSRTGDLDSPRLRMAFVSIRLHMELRQPRYGIRGRDGGHNNPL